jgi:hypothetical protein
MPGERVGSVHVDQLLSNLAVLYRPQLGGMIADQVCPILPVQHESDIYPVFNQGDFYGTDTEDLVADRAEPLEVEFGHTTAQYKCERRELAWTISDRERGNADSQLRLEQNKQAGTLARLYLRREARVATLLKKTSNGGALTSGNAAAADWGTAGTTSIESDIITGIEAVRQAIGVAPNTMVIPFHVAIRMTQNAQIRDWLKYNVFQPGVNPLSDQLPLLPNVFFGCKVLVPAMIQNTAAEGATASYSDVWGDEVRLLYVTSGPSIDTPSVAYTFQSEPLQTRRQRQETRRVDWFGVGFTIAENVVSASAGYEIANCAA